MFSLGRLVMLSALGLVIFMGFFAVPPGERAEGQFQPEVVAASEVAAWRAADINESFSVYLNLVLMLREQHRYSWFRAAEAAFYLARAMTASVEMTGRFQRLLPDLEQAATIQRDWMGASFDPSAAARAQMEWWATWRSPNLNNVDTIGRLIADEYAARYQISPGQAADAGMSRAEAIQLMDQGGIDPNLNAVTRVLTTSYRSLQVALQQPRRRR